MPVKIENIDGKYLYIKYNGPVNQNSLIKMLQNVSDITDETGVKYYLFDLRKTVNMASIFEHCDVLYNHSKKFNIPKGSKHALLVDDEEYAFVAILLKNNGYDGALFRNEADALKWFEI